MKVVPDGGMKVWHMGRSGGERQVGAAQKAPQLVARRNARERRRVQSVNLAFARLRRVVPVEHNRGKRVSKVKTLQRAIQYISDLLSVLHQPLPTRPYHQHLPPWECRVCVQGCPTMQ